MPSQLLELEKSNNYDEIIKISSNKIPAEFTSYEEVHAIGKAFEKKNAFSQCIPWYERGYELGKTDEALGMLLGVCFATAKLDAAEEYIAKATDLGGYYYNAGKYQLAFRKNKGAQAEIAALEGFIDVQYEETYMLRLATLYVLNDEEKSATKICRKIGRLFLSGEAVDYANRLIDAIKAGNGKQFIHANPWKTDNVFKHLTFDLSLPAQLDTKVSIVSNSNDNSAVTKPQFVEVPAEDTMEEKKPSGLAATIAGMAKSKVEKKETKDKIAPIIEKSLADVVGMEELKQSMNSIFNMMQMNKKRVGAAILKNNIRIYGSDGCGKTTAAYAAARTLAKLGIVAEDEPIVTDYDSLVGDQQTTADNIQKLFEDAENHCILIENIHEFDDSGAYSNGLNAIDMLLKAYEEAEETIPFIITGSENEVEALLNKKKKFSDLFNLPYISVGKYTAEELVEIAVKIAENKSLILDDDVEEFLLGKFEHMLSEPDFKYSRDIDRIINEAYIQQVSRITKKRRQSDEDLYLLKVEDFEKKEEGETVEELLLQLDSMTGLNMVKEQVNKIVNQVKIQKMREEAGLKSAGGFGSLHLVFLGNAGTGKTTVARIIGKIYKRLGVLPEGQLIECTRRDLVSEYAGATAQKVAEKVKEAMGGILFIDEAYTLCKEDSDTHGREAIDALLTDIENHRDSLMVILAGYSKEMSKFMDQNQGLRSRIPTDIFFEDYTVDEMVQIFKDNIKSTGFELDSEAESAVKSLLETKSKGKDFGNARGVRNVVEAVKRNQSVRLGNMDPAELERNIDQYNLIKFEDMEVVQDTVKEKTVEDYMEELNSLTGLTSVKKAVQQLVDLQIFNNVARDVNFQEQNTGTLHMVFKGNAGTGKTTVARLLGNIYRELGALSRGQVIECSRSDLVAGYTGQTAMKVKEKVKEAMGGILFIDEAYTLANGGDNDFGKEAIDTLVADIENYRDDFMVIIAGYSDEMDRFLDMNQGLSSRFTNQIVFEDYTVDEMLQIFKNMLKSKSFVMEDALDDRVKTLIEEKKSAGRDFGNARGVRNIVDLLTRVHTSRIVALAKTGVKPTENDLQAITSEDIENCF